MLGVCNGCFNVNQKIINFPWRACAQKSTGGGRIIRQNNCVSYNGTHLNSIHIAWMGSALSSPLLAVLYESAALTFAHFYLHKCKFSIESLHYTSKSTKLKLNSRYTLMVLRFYLWYFIFDLNNIYFLFTDTLGVWWKAFVLK